MTFTIMHKYAKVIDGTVSVPVKSGKHVITARYPTGICGKERTERIVALLSYYKQMRDTSEKEGHIKSRKLKAI